MLQLSGKINTKDIVQELGFPSSARMNLKLRREEDAIYVKINNEWVKLNMCSDFLPQTDSIRAWYGYDHSAIGVTGVDIQGNFKVLPGATITYNAIVTGENLNGIRIRWDRFDGTNWVTNIAMGPTMTITWGNNPGVYKLRATVLRQCQGGTSVVEKTLTQATTYYNLISCGADLGVVRQTHTPITTVGQPVFWDSGPGIHFWDGTITDMVTDYIGEVYFGVGSYCGDGTIPTYYLLKRCSDNANFCTTTKIGIKNQRVKDSSNVLYTYTGETRKSAPYTQVTVTLVHEKIRCVDPTGDPIYWNLTSCSGKPPAQTPTPLPRANISVGAGIHGVYVSTGTTTTNPTNNIGEVNFASSYGCNGDEPPGAMMYSIIQKCSDGSLFSTSQNFTTNGQRVIHTTHGNMFWNGNTSTTVVGTLITVTAVTGTGCPGSSGITYYQLRKCGSQDFYYTTTNPGTANQRVTSGSMGELIYTGVVTTSSSTVNIGPVTIVSGQVGCTDEGAPPTFPSEAIQKVLIRNNCPPGQSGSPVTVSATEGQFTSTTSVAHANTLRDAWLQAQANALGTCSGTATYVSEEMSGFFTKNNCPSGQSSTTSYYYTIPQGAYTSTTSQAHANSLAQAALNSQGQSYANTVGECFCADVNWVVTNYYCQGSQRWASEQERCGSTPTGNTRENLLESCSSSCGCVPTHYSDASTRTITRTNCPGDAYSAGSVTVTATAGQFSSPTSKDDANYQRDQWMQQQANANAVCNYGNDYMGQEFTKSCPDGGSGSTWFYDIAPNTYFSTVSKAAANAQAQANINANGQNAANTNGVCTWYSDFMSVRYYKECPDGGSGSSFDYELPAGYFSSNTSKAHANSLASANIAANGQNAANSMGVCTWCPDNRGHYINKNNCAPGQSPIPYLVYYPRSLCELSSNDSKDAAENNLNSWFFGPEAQTIANSNGSCSTVCPPPVKPEIYYDRILFTNLFGISILNHNGSDTIWLDIRSTNSTDPNVDPCSNVSCNIYGTFALTTFTYEIDPSCGSTCPNRRIRIGFQNSCGFAWSDHFVLVYNP